MTNLLLTTACNRDCPYCFARGELRAGGATQHISLDHVDRVIDFLVRDGVRNLSLLGGEPTLHPHFREIFARVWDAGFSVFVFTNGLMGDEALACLEAADPDGLIITININHPRDTDRRERRHVRGVLERLGTKAMAGFNISTPDVDMEFLIELIEATGITRYVRLGLAHPIARGDTNLFMTPRDSLGLGSRIVRFARRCADSDIKLTFDCGFLLCMFSDEELGRLADCGARLNFGCRSAIDIGPDLDVWRCFPLYREHRMKLTGFDTYTDVLKHFEAKLSWLGAHGCLPECQECSHLASGRCAGGCMSHKIRALARKHPG